jgi:hypothetical protein
VIYSTFSIENGLLEMDVGDGFSRNSGEIISDIRRDEKLLEHVPVSNELSLFENSHCLPAVKY